MPIVEIDTQQLFRGFVSDIFQETREIVVPMGFDINTPNLVQVDDFFGIENVARVIADTAGWVEWRFIHVTHDMVGGREHSVGLQLTMGEPGKSLTMWEFTGFISMGRKLQEATRREEIYLCGDGVEDKHDFAPGIIAASVGGNRSVVFDCRTLNDPSWDEAPKIIESAIVLAPNPEGVYVYHYKENTVSRTASKEETLQIRKGKY